MNIEIIVILIFIECHYLFCECAVIVYCTVLKLLKYAFLI